MPPVIEIKFYSLFQAEKWLDRPSLDILLLSAGSNYLNPAIHYYSLFSNNYNNLLQSQELFYLAQASYSVEVRMFVLLVSAKLDFVDLYNNLTTNYLFVIFLSHKTLL